MTTLAVLGDIHGNLPALEAVWNDLSQFDVDQVIAAGDTINWGPFSRQVLEFLDEQHCVMVRGNHEYYVLDYDSPRATPAQSRYTMPPYTHRQIGNSWRTRIAAWPDTVSLRFPDAPPVRVLHGSVGNPWQGIYSTASDSEVLALLEGVEESTVIVAHTHLPMDQMIAGLHLVNPGSVGAPLDGIRTASYMLLESREDGWCAHHRRVPFDIERVVDEFERQRFTDEHGVFGHLVIREIRTARCQVSPFLIWHNTCRPDEPHTLELLEQYTDEVRWQYTAPPYQVNYDLG